MRRPRTRSGPTWKSSPPFRPLSAGFAPLRQGGVAVILEHLCRNERGLDAGRGDGREERSLNGLVDLDPADRQVRHAPPRDELPAAGVLAFAAPKLTCAYMIGAHAGQAVLANGHGVALPLRTGQYFAGVPYFDSAAMPDARAVVLDRAPLRILLGGRPRN